MLPTVTATCVLLLCLPFLAFSPFSLSFPFHSPQIHFFLFLLLPSHALLHPSSYLFTSGSLSLPTFSYTLYPTKLFHFNLFPSPSSSLPFYTNPPFLYCSPLSNLLLVHNPCLTCPSVFQVRSLTVCFEPPSSFYLSLSCPLSPPSSGIHGLHGVFRVSGDV